MPRAATAKKVPFEKIEVVPPQPQVKKPMLLVNVDWGTLPIGEAQNLYAKLKSHFERAGAILNARTTGTNAQWVCYMSDKKIPSGDPKIPDRPSDCPTAGQVQNTLPRFTDYSHVDPKTGLLSPVRICSENCSIRYNNMLIVERREKYAPKRGE
jgi:hypothetical protein